MSAGKVEGVTDTIGVILPDPIITDAIAKKRAAAGPFQPRLGAPAPIEVFKTPSDGKPAAKDWTEYLTEESKSRLPSSLKTLAKYMTLPDMISLGGGLPCSEYFPIENMSWTIPQVGHYAEDDPAKQIISSGKYDVAEGKSMYDLSICLQYGLGSGSAQILRWVVEHTELVHNPPYQDWSCALSCGSTNSLYVVLRMLCNRGDYIVADEYAYPAAIETSLPLGLRPLPISMDAEGLLPDVLDKALDNWDEKARGARKPYVVYMVPTGQNPTGATHSAQRRKEIYAVAQKHNLILVEDEPYYFLQMQPYTGPDAPEVPPPKTHSEFLKGLIPSYLSLDIDGRVIRLDSFSKVISPGSRIGWYTASAQLIERIVRHNETNTQNPSGISQLTLFKLLDETWGHDGYLEWLIFIRKEYTRRRDALMFAIEKFLPKDVVSWHPPMAGMFLWMRFDHTKHPLYKKDPSTPILDIETAIFDRCIAEGVLLAKGSFFVAERGNPPTGLYLRATFAAASEDKMAKAIERLAEAVKAEWEL